MHRFFRNCNDAYRFLLTDIVDPQYSVALDSRNGPVLMTEEPVLVTYSQPTERVLFHSKRDCNPFFHLYEALWMLAGRNDLESVSYYNSGMKNYSDDGKTLNGAYGYRWRHSQLREPKSAYAETDQLQTLINHLKTCPNSRRAVLQMWNVEDDLLKIGGRCLLDGEYHKSNNNDPGSKDVCCNLSVMFSLRTIVGPHFDKSIQTQFGPLLTVSKSVLDMTVTNRSNDLLWGMLGANYVHFSFLQEYVASSIGVGVGKYNHFSNNLHLYKDKFREELLNPEKAEKFYTQEQYRSIPLVKCIDTFDKELPAFVEFHKGYEPDQQVETRKWEEPFLENVAQPMLRAYHLHKQKNPYKWVEVQKIAAGDWKLAVQMWFDRRDQS